jgi:hypothetical protein
LIVQSDARCFQNGLPIDFRFRSGHGDPFAFADRSTKLSAEGGRHVNNTAILKVQTAYLSAWTCVEGADARGLGHNGEL